MDAPKKIVKVEHIGDLYDGGLLKNAEPGTVFVFETDAIVYEVKPEKSQEN